MAERRGHTGGDILDIINTDMKGEKELLRVILNKGNLLMIKYYRNQDKINFRL